MTARAILCFQDFTSPKLGHKRHKGIIQHLLNVSRLPEKPFVFRVSSILSILERSGSSQVGKIKV